ncbi:hypothetical protein EGR_05008 [Echinococcus granulosus]|uniref:Uncharacterized protein n=1 Tax=Echinococcus granulosus TaxID=6210 RepID=W6UFF5_ECHGR|nr:hypothetical protein EGR_05008 [Echinococcus granulosus]EUB60155.1 hypothetical protein EGR_05008 [Echinococcus granulosus]
MTSRGIINDVLPPIWSNKWFRRAVGESSSKKQIVFYESVGMLQQLKTLNIGLGYERLSYFLLSFNEYIYHEGFFHNCLLASSRSNLQLFMFEHPTFLSLSYLIRISLKISSILGAVLGKGELVWPSSMSIASLKNTGMNTESVNREHTKLCFVIILWSVLSNYICLTFLPEVKKGTKIFYFQQSKDMSKFFKITMGIWRRLDRERKSSLPCPLCINQEADAMAKSLVRETILSSNIISNKEDKFGNLNSCAILRFASRKKNSFEVYCLVQQRLSHFKSVVRDVRNNTVCRCNRMQQKNLDTEFLFCSPPVRVSIIKAM